MLTVAHFHALRGAGRWWAGIVAFEDQYTVDDRCVCAGALEWPVIPLVLTVPVGDPYEPRRAPAGWVDWVERAGNEIRAGGRLLRGSPVEVDDGLEASVLRASTFTTRSFDGFEPDRLVYTRAVLAGVTVGEPAWPDARITYIGTDETRRS